MRSHDQYTTIVRSKPSQMDRTVTLIASIYPLISRHLVCLLGGPEKADVGGSIRLWPPFRINDLPRSAAVILRGHSYSFLVNG